MKRALLPAMAVLLSSGFFSINAQSFDASEWGKNQQTFNSSKTFTVGADGKSLTIAFGEGEANGLRRAEIANLVPLTIGGENTLVLFKVTYDNATFINFDKNMIYVRRQMRSASDAVSDDNMITPYFITNQNSNAGRYAANNQAADTEAYYWRYLPSLANENVSPTVAPDWSEEFELPSSFANNKAFKYNDQDAWGFSYLGIRLNHSADNADAAQGVLGNDATATFNYIGVTSISKLGYDSAEDFMAATSAAIGKKVKAYIESELEDTTTGIESIASDNGVRIHTSGRMISADGVSRIDVYNMAGMKVADAADCVCVAPGLYIVKAYGETQAVVRKIAVR